MWGAELFLVLHGKDKMQIKSGGKELKMLISNLKKKKKLTWFDGGHDGS